MTFEHSVDPSIRPSIVPRAEPAHGVASRTQIAEAGAADDGGVPPAAAAEDDFSFYDLLDIINPLQHIPVVSSLYREITGDEIKGPARILGGMLFGGPVGFVASAVNAIAAEAGGRDLGETAIATLFGDDAPVPDDTALADAAGTLEAGPGAPVLAGLEPAAAAADATEAAASTASAAQETAAAAVPLAATAVAEAPPGSSATELLMGRAALDALAADLRRSDQAPAPTPAEPSDGPAAATAAAATAAAATTATAATTAGVPANLVGIGSRDRRGLGPAMPAQPRPLVPEIPEPAAAARPPAEPGGATGTAGAPAGPQGRLALIDPALLGAPRPGALLSDEAAPGGDISAQMLDALKKYEALMQARRGGVAPAPSERPRPS